MYCQYCGSVIRDDAQFCGSCSKRQIAAQKPPSWQVSRKKGNRGNWIARHPIWTVVIVLFVLGQLARTLPDSGTQTPQADVPERPTDRNKSLAPAGSGNGLPEFSKMTVAMHLAEAKRLIIAATDATNLQEADSHLKEVLRRSPKNPEAVRLYNMATAAAIQIAAKMRAEQAKKHPQGSLARIKCEEAVTADLKAPSTAQFASYSETQVNDGGNWNYTVYSHVDAENSFGAHIRTPYTCSVQCVGVDACSVTHLSLAQ